MATEFNPQSIQGFSTATDGYTLVKDGTDIGFRKNSLYIYFDDLFSGDFEWDVDKSYSTYSILLPIEASDIDVDLVIPETEDNLDFIHYFQVRNYNGSDITIEFKTINGEDLSDYTGHFIAPDNYKYLVKAGSSTTITCICYKDSDNMITPVINAFSDYSLLTV